MISTSKLISITCDECNRRASVKLELTEPSVLPDGWTGDTKPKSKRLCPDCSIKERPPDFPADFYRHCRRVQEAKEWAARLKAAPIETEDYAECSFVPAGNGLACTECELFLTRPFCGHAVDEEWLPKLEAYYRDLKAWEDNHAE